MGRSYGGKEGVWLKRKSRKLSSSSFSFSLRHHQSISSLSSSIGAFSHSSVTSSTGTNIIDPGKKGLVLGWSNEEIKYGGSSQSSLSMVTATTRRTLSRIKQATLFKQRGSHFGGLIPKKYLLLQEQQQQISCAGYHYHNRNHTHGVSNHIDNASSKTTSVQPDQLRSLNYRNNRSNDNDLQRRQDDIYNYNSYTSTSPKPGHLIGWDSKKCRPIYSQQLQNNDDNTYSIHRDNDGGFDDNHDDHDNAQKDPNVNMEKLTLSTRNEDDDTLYSNTLEQTYQNYDRRRKANVKNRRTYTSSSLCRIKKRRGLMSMPLSVFERVESPQNKSYYQITSGILGDDDTKSNTSRIRTKKTFLKEYQHKCVSVRKHLTFNKQKARRTSFPTLFPSEMANTCNSRGRSISFAKNNEASKVYDAITINKSIKGSSDKLSPKENKNFQKRATCTSPLSLSVSACRLQFADDLDVSYNEKKDTKLPKKGKRTKVDQKRNRSQAVDKLQKNKRSLEKREDKVKKRKKHTVQERSEKKDSRDNGKDENSVTEEDPCHTVAQVKQISSSTSLCAAKAFFEQLDSYEMTIA